MNQSLHICSEQKAKERKHIKSEDLSANTKKYEKEKKRKKKSKSKRETWALSFLSMKKKRSKRKKRNSECIDFDC